MHAWVRLQLGSIARMVLMRSPASGSQTTGAYLSGWPHLRFFYPMLTTSHISTVSVNYFAEGGRIGRPSRECLSLGDSGEFKGVSQCPFLTISNQNQRFRPAA